MLMVTQDILGVLQQAAFMHAPEESPNDFASEEALDDTGRAVLIVAEILHGGHENHSIDEVVFEVSPTVSESHSGQELSSKSRDHLINIK
jgi:hypothetical protein